MADDAKLRAWWFHKQGLDGRLEGMPPADVLAETGWARSVGGVGPYLTLFARAGTSREAADAALASLAIHELPSARGCTYVLPAADFALGLRLGQGFSDQSDLKTALKLGATEKEIDTLGDTIVRALAKAPLDPEGLRAACGNAVRALGPEGVKKGVATTLPIALGRLQSTGRIRRIPTNGRLDQQRYRYAAWKPNPLTSFKLTAEEAHVELARRYFAWTGPATFDEFRCFSGLLVKDCRAAIEPLGLAPLAAGDPRLLSASDLKALAAFKVPRKAQYALVSALDGHLLLRRDVQSLIAPEDRERKVFGEKSYVVAGGLKDLPSHAILDRGRVVGLWEYDPATESIAWMSFAARDKALEKAVARTEEFVRTQLGDARSFSLDSPKSRVPRIEALRKAAR